MTDPISNERLLPCPFCGGDGLVHNVRGTTMWSVSCKNCDAGGNGKWTADLAIAAWNRRQSPAGVEVKPLEWGDDAETSVASGTGITYTLFLYDGMWKGYAEGWASWFLESVADRAEAKATAQADYERRILSCLSVEPAGVEPVAWLSYVAFPPDGGDARYEIASPDEDDAFPVYASPPPKAVTQND